MWGGGGERLRGRGGGRGGMGSAGRCDETRLYNDKKKKVKSNNRTIKKLVTIYTFAKSVHLFTC